MSSTHKHTDFSQINQHIYIGTNFCCTEHFDKKLLKKGITTDISLEDVRIDSPFGVACYLWLPVKNHRAPTQYQLAMGASVIDTAVKSKRKVYVHCKNGHGRAPTLVAAYLIYQGKSHKEAVAFLKSKRLGTDLAAPQLRALATFSKINS